MDRIEHGVAPQSRLHEREGVSAVLVLARELAPTEPAVDERIGCGHREIDVSHVPGPVEELGPKLEEVGASLGRNPALGLLGVFDELPLPFSRHAEVNEGGIMHGLVDPPTVYGDAREGLGQRRDEVRGPLSEVVPLPALVDRDERAVRIARGHLEQRELLRLLPAKLVEEDGESRENDLNGASDVDALHDLIPLSDFDLGRNSLSEEVADSVRI